MHDIVTRRREEPQLDAWEDDGGTVALAPKPNATLDLPVLSQLPLPLA
jgi:hypothetical protein